MAKIFVSHAYADAALADPFVDTVLKLGCEVPTSEIFYSSGQDTGVPDGSDLLACVRARASDAGLVIALISPNFQTRPVCVAELGAAWATTGRLLPLHVPEMDRADMEGVLSGMLVRSIADGAALDQLHKRVGEVLGHVSGAPTWNRHRAKWLANVAAYSAQLRPPVTVSAKSLQEARDALAGTQEALNDSEQARRQLTEQIRLYRQAENREDRVAALLPGDEIERFDALVAVAMEAMRPLDNIVEDAFFAGELEWPHAFTDRERLDDAKAAVAAGDLVENSSEMLVANKQMTVVRRAIDAIDAVRVAAREGSEEFDAWFREEHGGPPDLSMRRIWDSVFG